MSDMNKVILIGRLVRDPEVKYTNNGSSVCSFSIANSKTWKDNGEKKEQTSFFNCVSWGKQGEVIAQYFKKGSRIALEGRLQQRTWDDQNGNKRSAVEIVIEQFNFIDGKKQDDQTNFENAQEF